MKAARLIDEADVVLHDKLPGPEILEMIPVEKREDVGKRAGGEWTPQEYTNNRLVELAREGKDVVRLKGGDPFVFGRGGEEMEHLADNGIPFEVVPGITLAVAGAGAAGIPVTHRDHASSVSFVTGHEDPTKDESAVDWDALAATGGTLVVLMGVGKLPQYTDALRDAGMDPDTPVALVERATWPDQQVATGTLDTSSPFVTRPASNRPQSRIGEVAGERERVLAFRRGTMREEPRLRVAAFRPDDDRLDDAVELIESLGADPVPDPMLAIEPATADDAEATGRQVTPRSTPTTSS